MISVTDGSSQFGRKFIPYLRFIVAWALLANLPFWLAPYFIDARKRGYFDVEYILIGLASLRIPKPYIFLLFCTSCFLDILYTSSQLFYFSTNDIPEAAMYITHLPLGRVLGVFLLLSAITIVWNVLVLSVSPKAVDGGVVRISAAMLVFLFLLVGVDTLDGNNTLSSRDSQSNTKLSTAPYFSFAKMLPNLGRVNLNPAS
ncbi:MAG: hypothetical protein WBC04_24635 [Candidatus Acidiferrales bacterium]